MACVRKRKKNKWGVDWRDGAGIRHWKQFPTKGAAEDFRDRVGPEGRQRLTPAVPATITVDAYCLRWKAQVVQTLKPRTMDRYCELLDLHTSHDLDGCECGR